MLKQVWLIVAARWRLPENSLQPTTVTLHTLANSCHSWHRALRYSAWAQQHDLEANLSLVRNDKSSVAAFDAVWVRLQVSGGMLRAVAYAADAAKEVQGQWMWGNGRLFICSWETSFWSVLRLPLLKIRDCQIHTAQGILVQGACHERQSWFQPVVACFVWILAKT